MPRDSSSLVEAICALKREKNALILAHNYMRPEVSEVADYIGDSLGLCEEAARTNASVIVFCAVHFMAESAAILLPHVRVLLPNFDAGCALANTITPAQLRAFQAEHPHVPTVCYINSSAGVKALSDVVCTSANAVEIVQRLPGKQVLMVPDKNLANFVSRCVPEKEIIAWDGACPVHHRLTMDQVLEAKAAHPKARVLAHPECTDGVLGLADAVASTEGMMRAARESDAEEFLILTECGLGQRLARELPHKRFLSVCHMCYDMKKITLPSLYESLIYDRFHIRIDPETSRRARESFARMFSLTDRPITLPSLACV